jgi:putative nucleotidyltransferase with HDIG domain
MTDNPLYTEIYDDLINDQLVVPSMPEVALKIRRLVEDADIPVTELAKALNTDPAISAKLIKSANGALYHGQPAVDTCARAISRLGLNTTKHLVVSFVLRNLFHEKIHTDLLNERARDLWHHSVEIACISMALAQASSGLDAEEALLAGLLHDIGELVILTYAESYPDLIVDGEALDGVIKQLKAEIGAVILREWQFPEALVEAAFGAEEWTRDSGDKPDYCDVVLSAQLLSFIGSSKMGNLPELEDVPAFTKLAGGNFTRELGMKILDAAEEQILETKQLFLK